MTASSLFLARTPQQTRAIARDLACRLGGGEVVCVRGDLGVGKTTFLSGLICFYTGQTRILSPTYTIVRHYLSSHSRVKDVYHLDLYRVVQTDVLQFIGLQDMIRHDSLVVIEWPDVLRFFSFPNRRDVEISVLARSDTRRIRITHTL